MPNSSDITPGFRSGQSLKASDLETLSRMLVRMIQGDNKTIRVRTFGDRLVIEGIDSSPSTLNEIKTFTVVQELSDIVSCTDSSGQTVKVAKPFIMRRYGFDGEEVNGIEYEYDTETYGKRTATEGETEEVQYITPSYYANEIIMACRISAEVKLYEESGQPVMYVPWTDLNFSGRCWAKGTA